MFIAPLQFEGFVARLFFLNGQPSTVITARKTKHQACSAHNSAAPHDAHSSPALEAAHNSAGRHDTIRDHQQYALEGRRSVSSLMEFYQKSHMGKVKTLNKGIYIEEMLKDDSFYESHGTVRPLVANFKIRVPSDIEEQRPTSYAIYMT
ncbi:hypothetical protein RJT34_28174 [Clitoria ternatea]|uniref:Uncharacterized protein n=1 Tax=Clitoria ternatea TaxID=43366 RepID=A0AAN9F8Y9_CLITE